MRMILDERIDRDSSGYVRAAALLASARTARSDEIPDVLSRARRFISRDSWIDMDRVSGIRALGLIDLPEARDAIVKFLARPSGRSARSAAIAAVAGRSRGQEAEARALLVPLLDDDDLFIRIAAVRALAGVGGPTVIPALEARLAVEREGRVINVITGAIAVLRTRE
jgi:HEAT repeat protein